LLPRRPTSNIWNQRSIRISSTALPRAHKRERLRLAALKKRNQRSVSLLWKINLSACSVMKRAPMSMSTANENKTLS